MVNLLFLYWFMWLLGMTWCSFSTLSYRVYFLFTDGVTCAVHSVQVVSLGHLIVFALHLLSSSTSALLTCILSLPIHSVSVLSKSSSIMFSLTSTCSLLMFISFRTLLTVC
uniref:Uncharacterized protein n=1 Tax=Cacopsylla melanoneura TaxID=428564 RepID=A0A8D8PRK7_9HEMI